MGKVAKTCLFRRVRRCAHVVLRGRRGTLLHSTCVRCKTIVRLKLPCLWEKSQERVFFDVSEDVLMSFCVAGVALCCIPRVWGARLSWGWNCHAFGKSRKTCLFRSVTRCAHVVLSGRRGNLWHSTLYTSHSTLCTPHSPLHTSHSTLHTLHFTLYTPHSTLHTFHTLHSTLYIPHFTLHTPHSTVHSLHFTLHTLHSTL